MTTQAQEHFLRVLCEIAAQHYGCTVEEITFKAKVQAAPNADKAE